MLVLAGMQAKRTLLMRHESDSKDNTYWLGMLTHLQAPSVSRKVKILPQATCCEFIIILGRQVYALVISMVADMQQWWRFGL